MYPPSPSIFQPQERRVVKMLLGWASRARARLGVPRINPETKHVLAYRAMRRGYINRLWRYQTDQTPRPYVLKNRLSPRCFYDETLRMS